MRVVVISTGAIRPLSPTPKVLSDRCGNRHNGCQLLSKSNKRWQPVGCSINTPTAGHFGDLNKIATYLNTLATNLRETQPEKLKEFPWEKAKSLAAERLLIVGRKALKWLLLVYFAGSFLSDIVVAISANRELMIPLGLYTGVFLADFLKVSFQEFFQSSGKEGFQRPLMIVGFIFLLIKLLPLFFNLQGRVLISNIGNGGLMQVLWLAREMLFQTNAERQEQATDAYSLEEQ